MKRFKYLALAALVAFGACDEGEDLVGTDPITGSIQASVTTSEGGVAGVTVNIVGPTSSSQTTPASGLVTFENVEQGAYAVTISGVPSGYVCSNTSQTVTISTAGQQQTASFTCSVVRSASISGQVTANGEGVEGATIEIDGPDGTETTQSGASGNYQFTGLIAGAYTVTLQDAELGGIECEESTQERNLEPGESEVANFSCGGQAEPATVAIERITTQAGVAVDRSNVSDIIVVQVGVDEGGQDVTELNVYADGILVCSQALAVSTLDGEMAVGEEFDVDCVINTAAIRDINGEPASQFSDAGDGQPFEPIFLNGDIDIVAEAITADEDADDPTATASITLVNADVLALNVENDNGEGPDHIIDSSDGLRWLSGSLTFTVYPIVYSEPFDDNDPLMARSSIGFDSYVSNEISTHFTNGTDSRPDPGEDAIPASWDLTDINPDGTNGSFSFTLSDAMLGGSMSGGVLLLEETDSDDDGTFAVGVDDLITGDIGAQNIRITTVTRFGQNGPGVICSNISTTCTPTAGTVSPNPLRVFYDGVLQSGTGAVNNVLRVDNQEPWASTIQLDQHPLTAMFGDVVVGEGIMANGTTRVRGGDNIDGYRDGWVNHCADPDNDPCDEYMFTSSMWNGSGMADAFSSLGATDAPNFYGNHPDIDEDDQGVTPGVTRLEGIGLDSDYLQFFADHTEDTAVANALSLALGGNVGSAQRVYNAVMTVGCAEGGDWPCVVESGSDLPGDEGPGLELLAYPNTNEWNDISLTASVADLFLNLGVTNVLEMAVDGHQPLFRNELAASGTSPVYPEDTGAGHPYNTFNDVMPVNPSFYTWDACDDDGDDDVWCWSDKDPGYFWGTITDANNGFSGAAGVDMLDWENGCPAGPPGCAPGTQMNERTGVTLQPHGGAGGYLEWYFDAGFDFAASNTFWLPNYSDMFYAWDATLNEPDEHDGYRQQMPTAWDRGGNYRPADASEEQIADKTRPFVGNVEMPTVTMFDLGMDYTFGGQSADVVDLKYTDFTFDFHTLLNVQPYADELDGTGFEPGFDAYGNPYESNGAGLAPDEDTGNSLQLPLADLTHTDFGSAEIVLADNDHNVNVAFLGCVATFDEGGDPDDINANNDPDDVHIPRGPRWRTWDHGYEYGLINTQYNRFTPSTVPHDDQEVCGFDAGTGETAYDIRDKIFPSASTDRWDFGIDAWFANGDLELVVRGPSGDFEPEIDVNDIDLYYIDDEGRARILDLDGNWGISFVEDIGDGPEDRIYVWTWQGDLPDDTITPTHPTDGNYDWSDPYFFVLRFDDGTALLWDDSANPDGP